MKIIKKSNKTIYLILFMIRSRFTFFIISLLPCNGFFSWFLNWIIFCSSCFGAPYLLNRIWFAHNKTDFIHYLKKFSWWYSWKSNKPSLLLYQNNEMKFKEGFFVTNLMLHSFSVLSFCSLTFIRLCFFLLYLKQSGNYVWKEE